MRYTLDFGSASEGGTPAFDLFVRLDTLAAVTPPTITEIDVGEFYFDFDWTTAPAGVTQIQYHATCGIAEDHGTISGVPALAASVPAAGDLTTLAQVKAYLGDATEIADPLSASDSLLTELISRVSTWFNRQVGYKIAEDDYTETQTGDGYNFLVTRQFPVTDVPIITVDGTDVPESTDRSTPGYYVQDGVIYFRNWYVGLGAIIELAYTAGYAAADIPADIEQAVIEMVALKYRERLHVGNSSVSSFGTSVSFLPSIVPLSVREVIEGYRRITV